MNTSETTYYQDGGITITNARAVLGAKTYAMANITSVSIGQIPAKRTPGFVLIVVGLAISLCSGSGSNSSGSIVTALLVIGIGIAIAALAKPQYVVKIGSASGESNALVAPDKEHIQKVVNAVNEAIIKRG